jgi:chaperonin cofactor prefoldin
MGEKTPSLRTQTYLSMQARETNDLLSIWEKNDREEWTEEAFDAIREILYERTGNLPAQKEQARDEPQDVAKALQFLEQADASVRAGEIRKALQECEAAIELAPHLSAAYNQLGKLLVRVGRFEDAIDKFEEAVRLNPKDSDAERNTRKAQQASTKSQRIQHRKQVIRLMWRDGLTFGIVWVVFEFIYDLPIYPYRLIQSIQPIYFESAFYTLTGACSAAVLGYRIHPQKVISLAVGGALACWGGYMVGMISGLQILKSLPNDVPHIVVLSVPGFPLTLAFILMGSFLGAAFGIIEKDWIRLKWLILAGAVGFSIYFIVTFFYSTFVVRHIPISILVPDPSESARLPKRIMVVPPIIKYTVNLVRGILCGLISGALLGFVLRQNKLGREI